MSQDLKRERAFAAESRGGGAQGGEDAAGKRKGRERTGKAALEPGRGTTTPANSPRPDQTGEA